MTDDETKNAITELQDGCRLKVEVDPADDRFTLVTFRRPRTPVEVDREYEGQIAAMKFLKMSAASLQGSGLGYVVEDENVPYLLVNLGKVFTLSEGTPGAEGTH